MYSRQAIARARKTASDPRRPFGRRVQADLLRGKFPCTLLERL